MVAKHKFKNAVKTPVTELKRGDIILYMPLKATEWERGIVYDTFLRPDGSNHPSGFTVLPIETISKSITPVRPYPIVEKDNKRIVEEAGGAPGIHKAITQLHLKTVVNVALMTGSKTQNDINVIGSYDGSPFLQELTMGIEKLYKEGTLHRDGKLVEPTTRIRIVPTWLVKQAALENSSLRRAAYESLDQTDKDSGTIIAQALKESLASLNLQSAVDGGHISQRTLNFLADAKMPDTGKAPADLSEAFRLVTTPGELEKTPFVRKGGKVYESIIQEVTSAAALLIPNTPKP